MNDLEERLVFFACGKQSLAGVLTIPLETNGRAVLIPWGSGAFPSSGRNRIRARLARALAEHGFHAFRFDYVGVGESDGEYRSPDSGRPHSDEIVAASVWLESQGLERISVVAHCFGGWSSLVAAPSIPHLEALAVVNAPVRRDHRQVRRSVHWWAKRLQRLSFEKLRSPEHRAAYRRLLATTAGSALRARSKDKTSLGRGTSRETVDFSAALGGLIHRGIPVLLMYGNDDFRSDLEEELRAGLGDLIATAGPPTRLITVNERLEGGASLAAQEVLLEAIVPWLLETEEAFTSRTPRPNDG